MRNVILICVFLIALVFVVYSKAEENNMEYRQIEDDDIDAIASSESNTSDEDFQIIRRRSSSQCEPCGKLRRPCCFPDLCKHQPKQISKCFKVKG